MSLILSIEIRVAGVLTDADALPTLSDPTLAFGVRRTDTLAVIAASGTAFTHDGTGLYSYTIASPVAGVTYEYWPKFTVAGTPLNYQQTKTASAATTGTYSNQTLAHRMFGAKNVLAYSDLADAGTEDADNEQQWIDHADDWINLAFSRVGRTTPVPDTQEDYTTIQRIATEWWVAMMAKGRGDLPSNVSNGDAFDSLMDGHIERAEKALAELVRLWNENDSTDSGTTSTAGAITAVVGDPKIYPGTGTGRPAAITVPDLTGNASW